jgi:hypothetical protein
MMPLSLYVPDLTGGLLSAGSLTAGSGRGVGQEDDLRGGLSTGVHPRPKSKKGWMPEPETSLKFRSVPSSSRLTARTSDKDAMLNRCRAPQDAPQVGIDSAGGHAMKLGRRAFLQGDGGVDKGMIEQPLPGHVAAWALDLLQPWLSSCPVFTPLGFR